MTQEEKARAYDEALTTAKRIISKNCSEVEKLCLKCIFPTLSESEDERIRKWLLDYAIEMIAGLESDISLSNYDGIKGHDPEAEAELAQWQKARAYLEKQKENIEKEYVFRPLAGTDINSAALQAIRKADEGDRLVLAFNGAYIPVRKGCNANKIVDIYDAFIEKQKEPHYTMRNALFDKCVENCDPEVMKKVSDEVDEILEKEKQKEQKPYEPKNWPADKDNLTQEQKPAEWSAKGRRGRIGTTPEHIRKKAENFLSKMEPPYDADDICSAYETGAMENANPSWSEEDEKHIEALFLASEKCMGKWHCCNEQCEISKHLVWFKSLRPSWKPSEQEKGALRTAICVLTEERNFPKTAEQLQAILDAFDGKEARKDWKPSEEHLSALLAIFNDPNNIGSQTCQLALTDLYEQLKRLM